MTTSPPPQEFYFELSANGEQTVFQSVDGLIPHVALRNNLKSGDNPFKFRLPSLPKGHLNLKNGQSQTNSQLLQWASGKSEVEPGVNPRTNVELSLKDASGKSWVEWKLHNAKPVQNQVASDKATNQAAIQNLELDYSFYTLTKK